MGGLFKVWGVGEGCEPITEASLKEPQFGVFPNPWFCSCILGGSPLKHRLAFQPARFT